MVSLYEGKKAVQYARMIITQHVSTKDKVAEIKLPASFNQHAGVFVTLHTYPDNNLRGCIGIPSPIHSLKKALKEAAISVTHDPRFHPLHQNELPDVIIEITILTPPKLLKVAHPKDYINHIKIGRDGLIAEQSFFKGLLLPQVPIEQGWDTEEFLSQTCMKAGLMPDAWADSKTKIYRFSGQIFTEINPEGEIQEKIINGSGN